jgi:hypothetical protein
VTVIIVEVSKYLINLSVGQRVLDTFEKGIVMFITMSNKER